MSQPLPESPAERSDSALMRFWRGLSVTRRFSIVLVLVVAGTALIQGVVLFQIASNGFIALERERLTYRIRDAGKIIESRFETAASNVQALAQTPPIQGLIETLNHGGYYRKSSTRDWQARLSIIFTGFLKANPSYSQLRYIARVNDGRELVRVERVGSEILVREGMELQRKGDRDYFVETMMLSAGDVYISDIDLNREFGEIVEPFEPTVRIAVPVHDDAGDFFGIVILNVDFLDWSEALADAVVRTDRIYLTDDKGNYLIHPDPTMPFAWELGPQSTLWQDQPQFAALFGDDPADEVETLSGEDVLFGYRLHFDSQNLDRTLVLAASSPRNVLLASTYEMGRWSIAISIIMVVLAVILAQWMARPFVQLMAAARRVIDSNKPDQQGTVQDDNTVNVEMIADAFQVMENAVQEREAELRETEATTHAILDSAANPVISIDADGHIDRVNRSTLSTFGYEASELLGQHISIILKAAADWGTQDIPVGSQANVDLEATCKDGTPIPALVNIAEVSLENTTFYTIAIVDLRELRKAEKAKNEFVSVVSHELRTPLTSIRGALGLLQGPLKGELTPKVQELTTIAHKNSERLINIINDILDIEKLESGKVQVRLEPLNVNAALRQAVENNAPYGERYGVTFVLQELPGDPMFMADPGRFQQVMSNLLSNAAKFSDGASTVEIGGRSSGQTLHLTVRDHGAGMSEEFKKQAFGKFMQGEASLERRHEGTGLGLAITRMLVRAMGGDVTFESELGKGTCFEISLPLAQDTGRPAGRIETRAAPERTRILICEDDTDTRTILEAWIKNDDRLVADSVATLAEAREAIGRTDYAVVVLDLTLPDGDGSELIRQIHGARKTSTKVVVVTGMAGRRKDELDSAALPVADWLLKPIGQYQLMESIRLAQVPAAGDMPRILHVEDDPDMASIIARALEGSAIVVAAPTLARSRDWLVREQFDMIVLDLDLPDGPGADLLDTIEELKLATPVIILSASEVDEETRSRTLANVVKSRISDGALVDMIRSHLKDHTAT